MSWDRLVDDAAIAELLPPEYHRFATPVQEALMLFVQGLPAQHQAEIFQRQAALPWNATPSQRLGLLALLCPVLHKLGQVIARDQRLAVPLRRELRKLESLPPTTPIETIHQTLEGELGSLDQLGVHLLEPAIAEASVGVVVPFRDEHRPREGVFKVLKPGIEERLELELQLLEQVGAHLDEECHRLRIPALDYRDAFEQVRQKLAWELRLDQEQRNLAAARGFYADQPHVVIPRVFPEYCTPRVTAMQRIVGSKVTEHGWSCPRQIHDLAALVFRELVSRPIFSYASEALFHCDPHAGNLFLTWDGRLAILDWSLVGQLSHADREAVSQIMLGAATLRTDKVVQALAGIADRERLDTAALYRVAQSHVERLSGGGWPGLDWLLQFLDEAVRLARVRVAGDLLLFRKSLLTLEGVVAELGASGFHWDQVLVRDFVTSLGKEWPLRCISFPSSRRNLTRLSNIDLVDAMFDLPWMLTRRLAQQGFNGWERLCLLHRLAG